MPVTRTSEIVWIGAQKPSGLDFTSKPDAIVTYEGTQQMVKME